MRDFLRLFKIKKQERIASIIFLIFLIGLNSLMIINSFNVFINLEPKSWNKIISNFIVSGFDPITYSVITDWACTYNVYRHPLLSFFVWPLSCLDSCLIDLTGVNLVQFIVAIFLIFFAFYTFIFLYRIFKEIIKIRSFEAWLLSSLMFSFAYIMLCVMVPDHFCLSMFLLIMALYVTGRLIDKGKQLGIWKTIIMAIITSGVTLTNGVKIYIYALFTNGKRFFRPKYLLFAVILPAALLWNFARWEYHTFVWPNEMQRKASKARQDSIKDVTAYRLWVDTISIKDSIELKNAWTKELKKRAHRKYIADHKKAWNLHTGKPITKGEFMGWSDISTSRGETIIENLFGESIQFHDKHFLEDTLRSRPVIIQYSWVINYIVEAIIFLLFVLGIFFGRKEKFLLMALSGFLFDMALHLGLGFGINEVYIMGAHWLFVIPIAIAYLLKATSNKKFRIILRSLLVLLVAWLLGYNGTLLVDYFV